MGGVTGLVAAVAGGAPNDDAGGAESCWLGFPKGSIPANQLCHMTERFSHR